MEDMFPEPYDTPTRPLTPDPHRSPKSSRKKEAGGRGEVSVNSKNKGFRAELENIQEEDDVIPPTYQYESLPNRSSHWPIGGSH
jgi:hypothetical protein